MLLGTLKIAIFLPPRPYIKNVFKESMIMFRNIFLMMALVAFGFRTGYAGDEEKKNVMNNMKISNDKITSLQAKMKQRKTSSFMDNEVVSRAVFYYSKPGKYMLDPGNKEDNQYVINGKEIWMINHKNKSVTITNDAELNFSQYMMGIGNSMDVLETYFDVKVGPKKAEKKFNSFKMELTPLKNGKLDGKFEKIVVFVRDDLWLPYGAELYENDGDTTVWEFTDFKINQTVKEDLFKQEVPKGYTVKKYEKK